MPANASFDKGAAIEEWADTRFFRPIGLRVARASFPTGISPDQITMAALAFGLGAAWLCYYNSVALNAIGVALFIVSDIFDSADGQLARMRGTSTRFGKILDGLSDGARFATLYILLIIRACHTSELPWWVIVPVGVAAGLAHARQSGAVDVIRQMYMYLAEGGGGEFNLEEDFAGETATTPWSAFQLRFYRFYLRSNARVLPRSVELVRRLRATRSLATVGHEWATLQLPVVRQCAWIAQNVRFLLLAITVVPGYPMAFFLITLVPMMIVLAVILSVHERRAATLLPQVSGPMTAATA